MDNSKYDILIVDDIAENLRLVSTILEKAGFNTKTVRDGLTTLRLAKENDYDLILLDIMMPIMGGIETCKYLKDDPASASIPVIFLTASDDRETLLKAYQAGGVDYLKKPFFKEELLARVSSHLKLKDYEKNLEQKVRDKTQEISDTQVQLMHTLGSIAEGHSKETALHVQRVSEFTYTLAKLYGIDEEEALLLKDASSLHDIGKLGISDSILHKKAALSNKEFKEIKKHPALGAEMLSHTTLPLLSAAAIVCKEHHEKWDGSGYPNSLKGEDIHIYGRIVAIADVFDALSFKRAYKEGWTQTEVLKYLKDMSGKHFDPHLIKLFFANVEQFLKIYDMELAKHNTQKPNKKKMEQIVEWLFKGR